MKCLATQFREKGVKMRGKSERATENIVVVGGAASECVLRGRQAGSEETGGGTWSGWWWGVQKRSLPSLGLPRPYSLIFA